MRVGRFIVGAGSGRGRTTDAEVYSVASLLRGMTRTSRGMEARMFAGYAENGLDQQSWRWHRKRTVLIQARVDLAVRVQTGRFASEERLDGGCTWLRRALLHTVAERDSLFVVLSLGPLNVSIGMAPKITADKAPAVVATRKRKPGKYVSPVGSSVGDTGGLPPKKKRNTNKKTGIKSAIDRPPWPAYFDEVCHSTHTDEYLTSSPLG